MVKASRPRNLLSRPGSAVLLCFTLGVAMIMLALLAGPGPRSWSQVLYDVGMGALVATALAALLGLHLRRLEMAAEASARRLEQEAAELAKRIEEERVEEVRARQRAWERIDEGLDRLERDLDRALIEGKIGLVGIAIVELGALVEEVQEHVMAVREKVDTRWVHPHQPARDELMRLLKEKIAQEHGSNSDSDRSKDSAALLTPECD